LGNLCSNCNSKCKTCNVEAGKCTSCDFSVNGFFYDNNDCKNTCPEGKFGNETTSLCQNCNSECFGCVSPGGA
jgi:proprotein convertase subtilisin/kexin type 5